VVKNENITWIVLSYVIISILILAGFIPFFWMISTSLKPSTEVFSVPLELLPKNICIENYRRVIFQTEVPKSILNSFIVSTISTIIAIIVAVCAGYGFARVKFRGSDVLLLVILFSQMLPRIVLAIPLYSLFNKVGLINTKIALIIANLAVILPLSIWLFRGFFSSIPRTIEEAAMIDGCAQMGALFKVLLPNMKAPLAAVTIFAFFTSWEEFIFALHLTATIRARTLPIVLSEFRNYYGVDWGGIMASSVFASFPVVVAFLFLSKYFVKGMMGSAVKG